jgi:hypothetical protein
LRIFKNKWFVRFARKEGIEDADLCKAARDIEQGLIDADLGGGAIKQRIARPDAGKSGGFRSIVLFRAGDKTFFVYGFAKNARNNIRGDELKGFKALAKEMFGYDQADLIKALMNGVMWFNRCDQSS